MPRPVRIGFVGVGNMGQAAHLRHYAALPECHVVALAEPRDHLATAVAARYGVGRVYASAEAMLDAEQLDGIVAIQPFDRHGSIVLPLYRHGIPILTEKPLASSVEVGQRMMEALEATGSWHMVGYHKRNDPAVKWVASEIERLQDSEDLGKLQYVRITMPPGDWIAGGFDELVTSDEQPPDVMADPRPSGLSPELFQTYTSFVNYYIHQVNLLRHLLGEPYEVVFADRAKKLLVAESLSGVTGIIEMQPYTTTSDWQESALVCFEKGWLRADLVAPLAQGSRAEGFYDSGEPHRVEPELRRTSAMREQAGNFIRSIQGEATPACEASEALLDLEVAQDWLRRL